MAKAYPSGIYNFLVAENLRQEVGGKVTIIGAFSVGQIFLQRGISLPATLPLAFFVVFKDGEGTFEGKVLITDPNKNQMTAGLSLGLVEKKPGQGMQFVINLPSFPIVATCDYVVEVMLDDRGYQEHFSVGFAPESPSAASPTAVRH